MGVWVVRRFYMEGWGYIMPVGGDRQGGEGMGV